MNENRQAEATADKQKNPTPLDENKSRYDLARLVIICYMLLVVLAFFSPAIIYYFIGFKPVSGKESEYLDKIVQILNSYIGALTGMTGLVGFIVGYYFKGTNEK